MSRQSASYAGVHACGTQARAKDTRAKPADVGGLRIQVTKILPRLGRGLARHEKLTAREELALEPAQVEVAIGTVAVEIGHADAAVAILPARAEGDDRATPLFVRVLDRERQQGTDVFEDVAVRFEALGSDQTGDGFVELRQLQVGDDTLALVGEREVLVILVDVAVELGRLDHRLEALAVVDLDLPVVAPATEIFTEAAGVFEEPLEAVARDATGADLVVELVNLIEGNAHGNTPLACRQTVTDSEHPNTRLIHPAGKKRSQEDSRSSLFVQKTEGEIQK